MKISETGRSMVEMLGVLAIMGVLTVGVMLGYRYAMDRILTNSIITGVRARSVIIGQQRVLGQPLNLKEFHPDTEKDLIYGRFEVKAFNNYVYDGEESQAMEVHNIPRRVCENIRMLTFPDETITLVNRSDMGECITDGPRENTGGLHDGGDYFTAEYHNVVTFIFAGLGEACSVNQDCQEGLCCVSLEEGGRGCLPCEDPTDCDPCQEWNGTTCVNKAEDSQCLWAAGTTGCCKSGVCGACPNMCLGQSCDTLCQTCDSATGECVNHPNGTGCGECKRCENGACVPDLTLPGCTPQCITNADCGACEKCENKACVPDMTLPGCTPQCTTNTDCGTCEKCENKACVADLDQDGQICDSEECSVCANGTCQNKMVQRTICNGTKENCCPLNGKTCEDETECCTTDDECTTLEKSSDCPFKCELNKCVAHKKSDDPCYNCNSKTGEKEPLSVGYHVGKCLVCRMVNGQITAVDTTSDGCCWNDEMCQKNDKCRRCTSQSETIVGSCEKKDDYEKCSCEENQQGIWMPDSSTCCPSGTQINPPLCARCCDGTVPMAEFDIGTCKWECGLCWGEEECWRCKKAGGTWI